MSQLSILDQVVKPLIPSWTQMNQLREFQLIRMPQLRVLRPLTCKQYFLQMQQQAALMQQQAAAIAALQVQLAVAQAPGNPIAAQAPAFALTPALAQTGIIDFTSASGIKLRKTITMPLTTLYDGSMGTLMQFLDEVQHRANNSGWNQDLLTISDQCTLATQCQLITFHRCLTLDDVRFHAMQYMLDSQLTWRRMQS